MACGTGWSSIAMARAYPRITVDGFDLDDAAIEQATRNAHQEGVADRVTFRAADAADPGFSGRYDLATIFEALHDMSRPVEALRASRSLLDQGGWVLVADELVGEDFSIEAGDRERYVYAWSVVSCLPDAMGDPDTAATGAVTLEILDGAGKVLCAGGGLPGRRSPADRDRVLAVLPADPLTGCRPID